MSERRIMRRRGEGIHISGPATIHVSRRVTLIVNADRQDAIARLPAHTSADTLRRQRQGKPTVAQPPTTPCRRRRTGEPGLPPDEERF